MLTPDGFRRQHWVPLGQINWRPLVVLTDAIDGHTRETAPSHELRETGPSHELRGIGLTQELRETRPSHDLRELDPSLDLREIDPSLELRECPRVEGNSMEKGTSGRVARRRRHRGGDDGGGYARGVTMERLRIAWNGC